MSFTGPKGTVHERKGILQLDGLAPSEALPVPGDSESTFIQRSSNSGGAPEQQAPMSALGFQSPSRRLLMTRKRSGLLAPSECDLRRPAADNKMLYPAPASSTQVACPPPEKIACTSVRHSSSLPRTPCQRRSPLATTVALEGFRHKAFVRQTRIARAAQVFCFFADQPSSIHR